MYLTFFKKVQQNQQQNTAKSDGMDVGNDIINMLNNVRRACASGSYIIFKIRTANLRINLDSEDSEGSWDDSE